MGSNCGGIMKPHAVCVPYPAQGHINPMFQLAKLLHHAGFHVTFVNSEYNHRRFLKSRGPQALDGLPDFRYETIPDGLPPSDVDVTQDIPALCDSTSKTCLGPFRDLVAKLNDDAGGGVPPVSCIVSDGCMSFTLDVAEELGVPEVLFWTPSACGFLCYLHYDELIRRGLVPLEDASNLTDGFLDTTVDGLPGLIENFRLKDFPNFLRTTDPDDVMLRFIHRETGRSRSRKASAIILNTFHNLEHDVVDAMKHIVLPPVYTVGPLSLLSKNIIPKGVSLSSASSSLWKEDATCLEWLEGRDPGSVVYVNFGSITVMTNHQMVEFAWGLCNSGHDFLWVIRPDLVRGDSAVLPEEFLEKTKGRSLLASWCPQEEVLAHPAVGGFLTHSGWNSTLESICAGVPTICWPFFAEQQTNCRYSCSAWGVGMEIDSDVKREGVEELIRELMDGDEGKEMRRRAQEWKGLAIAAAQEGGSSWVNLDKLIKDLLLRE